MIDDYGNNVFFINNLPVKGSCTENEDGSHSIFIRAQLSDETKRKVYLHELKHIINDDFSKADVQEIEYEAHRREVI